MVFIVAVIIIIAVFLVVSIYNSIIKTKNESKEAWAQIETQMQKRFDLIPNLVETVKGYAKHESDTLEAVTNARSAAQTASSTGDVHDVADANKKIGIAINAVSENYPELKADANFLALQETLEHTEESISAARRMYNNAILEYNNKIQTFPNNIIASIGGFKEGQMFEINDEDAAKPVKVQF